MMPFSVAVVKMIKVVSVIIFFLDGASSPQKFFLDSESCGLRNHKKISAN